MRNLAASSKRSFTVLAPAKLNLTFDILSKRTDGYHDILTLFQAIDLCDELDFHFLPSAVNEIRLQSTLDSNSDDFPLDDSNLITKAAKSYWSSALDLPPVRIEVATRKKIPIGAGLAGGSANAAATLMALNNYHGRPLSNDQLSGMAATLGSDISFCLTGGSSVGRGRGELLCAIEAAYPLHFVIVKPKHLSISTAWAYSAFAQRNCQTSCSYTHAAAESHNEEVISNLIKGDLGNFAKGLGNAFEPLVFEHYPLLGKLQAQLVELGCLCAHMTGSGPTMYGLVKDAKQAESIAETIKRDQIGTTDEKSNQEGPLDVWVSRSINHGVQVAANEEG